MLCPAGYDPEVVFLVAVLQNLGRLLVQYHFADEAEQIWQLMRPLPPPVDAEPGTPNQPGMTEASACEDVQQLIRRLPRDRAARTPDGDADVLRTAASAANEAVDAAAFLPPARIAHGLDLVAQRYARALEIGARDLQEALKAVRVALRTGRRVATAPRPEPADAPGARPAGADAPR